MARLFTLDEATALLPRLREILTEMQGVKQRIDSVRDDVVSMTETASGNGHLTSRDVNETGENAQQLVNRLNELGAQVAEMGCEVKGIDQGLIDFPTEREGRTVYLCWQLGEEAIDYWHELHMGFAGRQPL